MPGAKRDPSSFIHATTATDLRGGAGSWAMACAASSAAMTP